MRAEELRMRMEAAIGMAPPLTDSELVSELREEAARYEEEKKLENEQALVNLMSDIVAGTVLFSSLVLNSFGRRLLFNTISRFAGGLSDTSKAFLIILVADTLLGYHSEEGWTAALTLLAGRYGSEPGEEPIALFVAVLPVTLDTLFKYWIFRGLNRQSPSAAVTLKEMDRH